jgi:hypothetical protein
MVRLFSLVFVYLYADVDCGYAMTGIMRSGHGTNVLRVRIRSSGSSFNLER